MPKLPPKSQAKAAATEAWKPGTRGPWEPGKYLVYAKELVQKPSNSSPDPYWNVMFKSPAKYDQGIAGCVFEKISTGESSAGKQRAFFEAFGFTVDSNTDEFVGKPDEFCWIFVDTEPGFKDPSKLVNTVLGWSPVDRDDDGKIVDEAFFALVEREEGEDEPAE